MSTYASGYTRVAILTEYLGLASTLATLVTRSCGYRFSTSEMLMVAITC